VVLYRRVEPHVNSRFRITLWPDARLPHPQLGEWRRPYRLEDGVLVPNEQRNEASRRHSAAADPQRILDVGEIYLELARLDLDDEEAIVDFASRFRTLGVRHEDFAAYAQYPGFDEIVRPALARSWPVETWDEPGLRLEESLEEFRFGARCIRDLVGAWAFLAGDVDEPQWVSLPYPLGMFGPEELEAYEERGLTPTPETQAATLLERFLTPALTPFQPRVLFGDWGADVDLGMSAVIPLYSVCCLELYNHIAEQAHYRRCGNLKCQRLFVRQRGRSEHEQHRTHGVLYCSKWCANAEMQRRNRERQRAKKANGSSRSRAKGALSPRVPNRR
jgi:hypothetical protein